MHIQEYKRFLEKDVKYIKGIGPNLAQILYKRDIFTVKDALFTIPRGYENRKDVIKICDIVEDKEALCEGEIVSAGEVQIGGGRKIYKMVINDGTGNLECIWFSWGSFVESLKGTITVYGRVKFFRGIPQMYHPKIVKKGRIQPVYFSDGVISYQIGKAIKSILESARIISIVPERVERELGLMDLETAIKKLHLPDNIEEIEDCKKRVIFEKIFEIQVSLFIKRKNIKSMRGVKVDVENPILNHFLSNLGFRLTKAQMRCLEEIKRDLGSGEPMYRLLQGDVGSGKTVVAFGAGLLCVASGHQTAFMVPTEILAEQHYKNMVNWAKPFGVEVKLLTGSIRGKEREDILKGLEKGYYHIVVGTHALIYEKINFKSLGLCVIDEQHRFGVAQRLELSKKFPHILVMSATPIPRTLSMTVWGDLDISVIDEMPPGRKPVKTKVFFEKEKRVVYNIVKEELRQGGQVFFIYPLISESEKLELPAAEKMYEEIKEMFENYGVGLIHGRIKQEERQKVLSDFRDGKIRVLVSTTVIEVGIDIPDATMIVIEHAERFGLSQIHQLRGRVGRSDKEGKCILIIPDKISQESLERIKILERVKDGFELAEEDLKLRGPGEILGERQHGKSKVDTEIFRYPKLISLAREYARKCIFDENYLTLEERVKLAEFVSTILSDKIYYTLSG